jgi:RNA polymerase sigma-70 factor (ECF subfamily)
VITLTKENFKKLFDQHFEEIRRYIFFRSGDPNLSDDIAQQTFLKLWEKQILVLPGKEKALLFKIAGNEFIDTIRKRKLEIDFASGFSEISEISTPDEILEVKELKERFNLVLGKMKEKQRLVFLMSRMEGLKYSEISVRLNISVKAVEKRMNGALSMLNKELIF